jgi:hypothetical protein
MDCQENLKVHSETEPAGNEWDEWFGDDPVRWVEVEVSTDPADDPDADPVAHLRVTIDAEQAVAIWEKKIAELRRAYGST